MTTPVTPRSAPAPVINHPAARRLDFLDALRGIAAISVAFVHRAEATIDGYTSFDTNIFRFGQFGVVLFFLCSGFIIPASLERYGSLRQFWVGRFFRLFPLYWIALAAFLTLYAFGIYELPAFSDAPITTTLANLTMLQAFTDYPLIIGLSWTLAFEMCFYLIISAFFVAGLHRKSMSIAAPAIGVVLSLGLANAGAPKILVALALLGTGALAIRLLLASPSNRQRLALLAVAALAGFVLFNGFAEAWFASLLLTAMLTGTVLYRLTTGEQPASRVIGLAATSAIVAVVSCTFNGYKPAMAVSIAAAYAVFVLALWQRHRRYPRALVYLGAISYSLYLLHPIGYAILGKALNRPFGEQMAMLAGGLAIAVVLSALTYRYVEQPFVRLGRRVSTRKARTTVGTRSAGHPPEGAYSGLRGSVDDQRQG